MAAEVVLADSRQVAASPDEHPDLLWALRGGGGNFGVVTSFEFRLHRIDSLLAGMVMWPVSRAGDVLRLFRDVTMAASDELTCIYAARKLPDGPQVALIAACYNGRPNLGEPAMSPLRQLRGAITDTIRPASYLEVQRLFEEIPFGLHHYWKGCFVPRLDDEVIEATADASTRMTSELSAVLVEAPRGAARRMGFREAAYGRRDDRYNVSALAIWDESNPDTDRHVAWARELAGRVGSVLGGASYVNYLGHDATPADVVAAYGAEQFDRLVAVKRRYDPANFFRLNQNIPPDAGTAAR